MFILWVYWTKEWMIHIAEMAAFIVQFEKIYGLNDLFLEFSI